MAADQLTQLTLFPQAQRPAYRQAFRCTYAIDEDFFAPPLTTEGQAWALGFISADGCVCNSRLEIALAAHDRDGLDKIVRMLSSTHPVSRVRCNGRFKDRPMLKWSVRSRRLAYDLMGYGVTPNKSLRLIPWQAPPDLARHYWRGLVDGDGSLYLINGYWRMDLCGSEATVRGFADYVRQSLGITPSRVRKPVNTWYVQYTRLPDIQAITSLLWSGATIYLGRKKATVEKVWAAQWQFFDWSKTTDADLLALYSRFGTWLKVAKHLGVPRGAIYWQTSKRALRTAAD